MNVLILHNRYRGPGGEERSVAEIATLLRGRGHAVEVLERDSAELSGASGQLRAAAGMLAGGLAPGEVAEAVRRTGADVVHAHNVYPLLGSRALAAARRRGRGRRHAPPQLPPVLLDRHPIPRRRHLHPLPGPQHAPRRAAAVSRESARGGDLRRRPVAPAAADPGGGRAVRRAERLRGGPPGRAGTAARPDLGCAQLPAGESVRGRATGRRSRSTRCTPGGWSGRRASTRRSRRPRTPACRWRSPAPVPRPSRSRPLPGAPARPCASSGCWSRPRCARRSPARRSWWRRRAGTRHVRTR